MRGRRVAVFVAVSSSVMLVMTGLGVATSGAASKPKAAAMRAARRPSRFITRCNYTHTLLDDPIVKPNQPGASHSHDFFGNVTTNAATTLASLDAGGTT